MAIRRTRIIPGREIEEGTRQLGVDVPPGVTFQQNNVLTADDLNQETVTTLRSAVEQADDDAAEEIVAVFKTQHDDRVRPSHAALHDTQWDVTDPARPIPPLGYGCRCYIVLEARTKAASDRTGLPQAARKPPEPGADALGSFFDGAETASGEQVTPKDIMGSTVGGLVENGDLPLEYALDDGGNPQKATIAKGLAKAAANPAARRAVEAAALRLQAMGITIEQARKAAAAAKKLVASDGISQRQALIRVLVEQQPGQIPTSNPRSLRDRATLAAGHILKMYGGSLG